MSYLHVYQLIAVILLLIEFVVAVEVPEEYYCSGVRLRDASAPGNISSPYYGFRSVYYDYLDCKYRIKAPQGYRIKLTFLDLDIYPSTDCVQDRLIVRSMDWDEDYGIYGTFCGSDLPRPILSKEGENVIELLFQTDDIIGGRGFLIQYESSPYFTSVCDSGYLECKNRNCYTSSQRCNGIDDCRDGTDEADCGLPTDDFPEVCSVQDIKPHLFSDETDRMVGGEETVPHSWPWMVSLRNNKSDMGSHFCGGALINAEWVVTAAHCVHGYRHPGEIRIVLGAHNKFKKSQYHQVRISKKIIAFPDLQGDDILKMYMINDVALIKMNAPVTFNKGVQPACLPSLGWRAQPGWNCYGIGWGQTRGTGSAWDLKQMDLTVKSRDECAFIVDAQICVEKERYSICHGDSGSPLQCKVGDKWYVFGVASYVTSSNLLSGLCAGPGAMGVYGNLPDKANWIKTIINKFS